MLVSSTVVRLPVPRSSLVLIGSLVVKVGVTVNNGQCIETYAIPLPEGSCEVTVNGAAARHFQAGDRVIIVAFCLTNEPVAPKMIVVDQQNRFVRELTTSESMTEPVT